MNASAHTAPKLLILADDLSGAADCAMAGVQAGLRSAVMLRADVGHPIECPTSADVLTLDADTWHTNAADIAATQVVVWYTLARPATRLYKKVGSTLRDNVAAEVATLAPLTGLAIIAPAFPAAERTTRDDRQWLYGVAVEDTEMWHNESIGGRTDLRVMLRRQGLQTAVLTLDDIRAGVAALASHLATLQAGGVQAVVCDAQTDDDLAHIAKTSVQLAHVSQVSSAGLTSALIRTAGLGSTNAAVEGDAATAVAGPVLTVVGSMSSVPRAQASKLKAATGACLLSLEPPVETLGTPQVDITQIVTDTLCGGHDVLVTLSQTTRGNSADDLHFCHRLVTLLTPVLPHAGGLIAIGGGTARVVLSTAGIDTLRLCDEIESGMPLLHAQFTGIGRVLPVATRTGGFGTPGSLHAT